MNIEQAVNDAIEEFGGRAFERFIYRIHFENGGVSNWNSAISNKFIFDNIKTTEFNLKPLDDLFTHDVEVYGDNAYLMWDVSTQWVLCFNFSFNDNFTVECALTDERSLVRRKTSAALPFDLERAKAGDAIEFNYGDDWVTAKYIGDVSDTAIVYSANGTGPGAKEIYGIKIEFTGKPYKFNDEIRNDREANIFYNYFNELHMKYPNRLKNEN